MINWKVLETKILEIIRRAMSTYNEKWVTAEVLCQHVGALTPRFLKDHGQMFNRTRVEWDERDKDGNWRHVASREWMYPLHEIMDMIQDGRIKELKLESEQQGRESR